MFDYLQSRRSRYKVFSRYLLINPLLCFVAGENLQLVRVMEYKKVLGSSKSKPLGDMIKGLKANGSIFKGNTTNLFLASLIDVLVCVFRCFLWENIEKRRKQK